MRERYIYMCVYSCISLCVFICKRVWMDGGGEEGIDNNLQQLIPGVLKFEIG